MHTRTAECLYEMYELGNYEKCSSPTVSQSFKLFLMRNSQQFEVTMPGNMVWMSKRKSTLDVVKSWKNIMNVLNSRNSNIIFKMCTLIFRFLHQFAQITTLGSLDQPC